jgi:hypothetical protein
MIAGEDADHDRLARRLEHPDVVSDVGEKVAGLVRDGEAGHVARDARPIELPAHDAQHQLGRALVDQRPALHHLEQPSHLARRREAEWMPAVAVERLGRRRGAQRRKPLRRHGRGPRLSQPERVHPRVHGPGPAGHAEQHFGRGVVRHDDHHRDEILDGHHGAGIEPLNRAGARLRVGFSKRVLVGELQPAVLDLLEHLHHQRDLDRAHRLHLTIGVDRDLSPVSATSRRGPTSR